MDADQALGLMGMPPRNPRPTFDQAAHKKPSARYVVEIRDAAGVSLLLTSADWTAKEREVALLAVLRLVGMKAAAPSKRQGNKAHSGQTAPRAKEPQKK
jgi:hypothetical protein